MDSTLLLAPIATNPTIINLTFLVIFVVLPVAYSYVRHKRKYRCLFCGHYYPMSLPQLALRLVRKRKGRTTVPTCSSCRN